VASRSRVRGIDEELWFGTYSDADAERKAAESVAATVGRVVGAKPFPIAAQKLAEATRDPNCNLVQVVRILERDMALSARVLRLVNSASFALRTPCTSVRHAASLVGTDKLNQLATTAAIIDMVDSSSVHASRILEHSAVVGGLCRYLAVHLGLPPDELFTCGFLHDIGKLMLLEVDAKKYGALLEEVGDEYDAIHLYERDLFGFDHALLAGHVLSRWSIPDPVPKVVAWHHHVTRAYDEGPRIASLTSVLRLADLLSYALVSEDDEAQVERVARSESASYLEISAPQLAAIWDEMRTLHERSRALFRGDDPPETMAAISLRPSSRLRRPMSSKSLRPTHPSLRAPAPGAAARASLAPAVSRAALPLGVAAPKSVAIRELPDGPRQFPCVVCAGPTFANVCAACHGTVCPEHQHGAEEWCAICWREFEVEAHNWRLRPIMTLMLGAGLGATVVGAFFSEATGHGPGSLGMLLGPLIGTGVAAGLVAILHRYAQRAWFLRSRPDRSAGNPDHARALPDEKIPDSGVRASAPPTEPASSGAEPPAAAGEEEAVLPSPPAVGVELTSSPDQALESLMPFMTGAPPSAEPPVGVPREPVAAHARTIAVLSLVPAVGSSAPAALPSWPPSLLPPSGSKEAAERGRTLRLLSEHGVTPRASSPSAPAPAGAPASGSPVAVWSEPPADGPRGPSSSPDISVRPLFGSSASPLELPEWSKPPSGRDAEAAPAALEARAPAAARARSTEAWDVVLQATGTADGW
jgi:HD-like signal output (HDOD) protein